MAQLVVRNVEPAVVRALKLRAAREGRSAEAEHRRLLQEALMPRRPASFKAFLEAMPALKGSDLRRSRRPARRVDV